MRRRCLPGGHQRRDARRARPRGARGPLRPRHPSATRPRRGSLRGSGFDGRERAALRHLPAPAREERQLHRMRGHAPVFPGRARGVAPDALDLIAIEVAHWVGGEVEVLVAVAQVGGAPRTEIAAVPGVAGVDALHRRPAGDDGDLAHAVDDGPLERVAVRRHGQIDREWAPAPSSAAARSRASRCLRFESASKRDPEDQKGMDGERQHPRKPRAPDARRTPL